MSFLGGYGKAWKGITKGALTGGTSLLGDAFGGGGVPNNLAQILGTLNQAQAESRIGYAKAGAQLDAQVPAIQKAYKMQGENLRYLADKSHGIAQQQGLANQARAQAQVQARGGGASNLATLATRGVTGDTNRALAQIDELAGQHFGDLARGEAGALSSIAGQKANLTAQGTNAQTSLYGSMADAYGNQQFVPKKNIWDVLGAAAPIVGTFAGLGGGGGGSSGGAPQTSYYSGEGIF
jgi:hypothetical protein